MKYSGQIYPNDAIGYFRIASPTGRQPIEPITPGEFLIGSGAQCNLRFGGAEIPEVHTVVRVEQDIITLTCVESDPQLLVNGSATAECQLADGDMIELGAHRLLFRLAASQARITLDEASFAADPDAEIDEAESLVDRLEEQIQLVEDFAHTPDNAITELLQAVAETAADQDSANASGGSTDLQEVKSLIQQHHEASRIRLESLTEVLDNVVRQQKLIADTLEVLSDRVQNQDSGNGFIQRRASA